MHKFTKIRDFHGSRARGVGSSDIPTLAGLTKQYGSTPLTLWEEKTGRKKREPAGDAAWWGHMHENMVLYRFVRDKYGEDEAEAFLAAKIKGRSRGAFQTNTECRHPKYRFILAHADLLILAGDEGHIQEAKSHRFFAARRDEYDPDHGYSKSDFSENGIPAAYYLQVQHQLLAYGVQSAGLSALIDTSDYREYGPIYPNRSVMDEILALSERFWWHVEKDTPPAPMTWPDVTTLFPETKDTTAYVSGDAEIKALEMVDRWHRIGVREKELKAEKSEIKNALGLLIGENKYLVTSEGKKLASTWTQPNPSQVDLSRIESEMPGLFAELKEKGFISQSTRRELRPSKVAA